uniref:Olfactomedin-like domain-containing protein n=1 Tax=Sus scrofa TaxID=9823 RepID=A0A8D0UQM7_PIG
MWLGFLCLLALLDLHSAALSTTPRYFPTSYLSRSPTSISNWSSSSAESQSVSNFTGSVDDRGTCQCSVILPDTTFPVERVERLEITAQTISKKFEKELSKVREYVQLISKYEKKLLNLTVRIEKIEQDTISYTELDFELIKIEVREMEKLIQRLKVGFVGSTVIIDQLEVEVRNEIPSHGLIIKSLWGASHLKPGRSPPPSPALCTHGGVVNVSKPAIVQLNWLGFSYKYGAWGRDYSPQLPGKGLYWVAPLNTNGRTLQNYRLYNTLDDLLLYRYMQDYYISYGQGSGIAVYNNNMYVNWYNTRNIARVNLATNRVEVTQTLPQAAYNNRFSYANVGWQDIDLAVDENGLWVIYATEASTGNIVISKLNDTTLAVLNTWHTKQYKPSVSNAFMVCGVLYATRTLSTRAEEIFYYFDTNTGQEGRLAIVMQKVQETLQSINYHPYEQKLFVYNDGYLLNYDLFFQPQ